MAVHNFLEWGLSGQAQNYGEQLGYIPLTTDVTNLGKEAVGALSQ
jgi:hypothetical protein